MKFSEIELPSNRKFGLLFTIIFALFAWHFFAKDLTVFAWVLALFAVTFAIIAWRKPEILLPLNILWMRLGWLLGMVVNPMVLGLIFFLIFTPTGLIMRLARRDELRLKPTQMNSHWKTRQMKQSFENQF